MLKILCTAEGTYLWQEYLYVRLHIFLVLNSSVIRHYAFIRNSGRVFDSKGTFIYGYMNKDTPSGILVVKNPALYYITEVPSFLGTGKSHKGFVTSVYRE